MLKKIEIKELDGLKEQAFKGSIYLLANNIGDNIGAKIFSFEDKKVLSSHVDIDSLKKKVETYKFFSLFS